MTKRTLFLLVLLGIVFMIPAQQPTANQQPPAQAPPPRPRYLPLNEAEALASKLLQQQYENLRTRVCWRAGVPPESCGQLTDSGIEILTPGPGANPKPAPDAGKK